MIRIRYEYVSNTDWQGNGAVYYLATVEEVGNENKHKEEFYLSPSFVGVGGQEMTEMLRKAYSADEKIFSRVLKRLGLDNLLGERVCSFTVKLDYSWEEYLKMKKRR